VIDPPANGLTLEGVSTKLKDLKVAQGTINEAPALQPGDEGPLPPFAIPATLQDSLAARLDRLAPVKEVAQIGQPFPGCVALETKSN
jgi:hypothetical protein